MRRKKSKGVIDDGRKEEVGGGDQGLLIVEPPYGIVCRRCDHQVGEGGWDAGMLASIAEYGRGDFAATSATVRQFGESRCCICHFLSLSIGCLRTPPSRFREGIDQLGEFNTIIDVRSPSGYRGWPGAISTVLDDEERVGTLYKQVSPFESAQAGGAW